MNTHILSVLRPTIIMNQFSGYFPYTLKNGNKNIVVKYSRFRKYFIAPTEFLLTFLVLAFYQIKPNFTSLLQILVHLIFGFSTFFATILIMIIQILNTKHQKEIYKKLIKLDGDFRKLHMYINYKGVKCKNVFVMVSNLTTVMVFSCLCCLSLWSDTFIIISYISTISYVLLQPAVVSISFVNFLNITRHYFEEINLNFNRKILNCTKDSGKQLITETCKLYQSVNEFSRMINKQFNFQLLIIFALNFVTFTSNLIYVYTSIIHRQISLYIEINLFWIIYCGIMTFVWIDNSVKCTESVSIFFDY